MEELRLNIEHLEKRIAPGLTTVGGLVGGLLCGGGGGDCNASGGQDSGSGSGSGGSYNNDGSNSGSS